MRRGAVFIAFGQAAVTAARLAAESFRAYHPRVPVLILGEHVPGFTTLTLNLDGMDNVERSRWAKVNLYNLSPFASTLYLDADTRVYGELHSGYDVLDDGFDIAIVPSGNQGRDVLWHVDYDEREATLDALAHVPVQLQGGVFWFRKSDGCRQFFDTWRDEWRRWRGQDQGALLRALALAPVRTWLMGRAFNGGTIVAHRFGTARG